MLNRLKLRKVGPAPEIEIDLAARTNFFTGDNGLGKSFLLDVAWWALTRSRAGPLVLPQRNASSKDGSIEYSFQASSGKPFHYKSTFEPSRQQWTVKQGRPPIPGLVIYAQVDGGFSVWDPARNYWTAQASNGRPEAFRFRPDEVWDGLPRDDPKKLCNGLIADWASWLREKGESFEQLRRVLSKLSPAPNEPLVPGQLTRISLDDIRDYPTVKMLYGQDVPLVHASAGMRRIIALAYLLVWTWQEHLRASELVGKEPVREIIFLIDEIEAHLHPQWQRRIVPALLEVMEALTGEHDVPVQLIAATHSPLILASVEPFFDEERDRLFHLGTRDDQVFFEQVTWAKQGDTASWLVSSVFGLRQARSLEAELAIEAAEAWMRGAVSEDLPKHLADPEEIDRELRRVLAGHDPFWPRWIVELERRSDDAG